MQPGRPNIPEGDSVLEADVRLSASMLWGLQHAYYERAGASAWSGSAVPEAISTNPYLARSVTGVVAGFLRDCLSAPHDPNQPVYIIELGAGSGRFAFHFLDRLAALAAFPGAPRFCYVMTDFAGSNITAWKEHPGFQPWIASGRLDFARFDAIHDDRLLLEVSGSRLSPGSSPNPLVVIANYLFDSLPQDVFTVQDRRLYESLVTVTSGQVETDPSDPSILTRVVITFRDVPASSAPYNDALLDAILYDYAQRLPGTRLVFPVHAIRCMQRLGAIAGGRMLLLAGDKGYALENDFLRRDYPTITFHGAFSLMVNFHAIGQAVIRGGGQYLHLERDSARFQVCAYLTGSHPNQWIETNLAYRIAIEAAGPDDFYTLREALGEAVDDLRLEEILALLRLSGWDAALFERVLARLEELAPSATPRMQDDLARALDQVWSSDFPSSVSRDLALDIGSLLVAMRRWEAASAYLRRSIDRRGAAPAALTQLAACLWQRGEPAEARELLHQALSLDPSWDAALFLLARMDAEKYTHTPGDGEEGYC